MKRIFELKNSEMCGIDKNNLIEIIRHSEGRTLCAETVVSCQSFADAVSNPELAAAFGADMITLNGFNVTEPFIFGYDDEEMSCDNLQEFCLNVERKIRSNISDNDYIRKFRRTVGRFAGCNLEPVSDDKAYCSGRKLSSANLQLVMDYGFNYIVITANPNTGISNCDILRGIELAKNITGDKVMIIAGKMHGAGKGNIYNAEMVRDYISAGADVVLLPSPGTVPGVTAEFAHELVNEIHFQGALAMTAFGTSQESSSPEVIEQISIMNKMAGTDIHHIGDAGQCGIAPPENIMRMSTAIRGMRHTLRRMGMSAIR